MEGSLLDMINHYMKKKMDVPGTVISTYTLDILRLTYIPVFSPVVDDQFCKIRL